MAQEVKGVIERLASFLKERELKGVARIFFKNGRPLLELILHKYTIDITCSILTRASSNQVIVITATVGGITGFTLSWFSAGAALISPALLISMLLTRSIAQNIVNQRDYLKFKKLINPMLKDNELKQTVRAFFMEGEVPTTTGLEIKPWDSDKNPLLEFHFDSDKTFEEVIKDTMKEELGLVENPTSEQLKEMVHNRKIRNKGKLRNKGKIVYFKDFVEEIVENTHDIVDVEIVKKAIEEF